jgi:putative colanic acid biosynthesis UDP-glucose lipid carrier transferase
MSTFSPVHRGVVAGGRWPRALRPGRGIELALRVSDLGLIVLGARLAHEVTAAGGLPREQGVAIVAAALLALALFPAAHVYEAARLARLGDQIPRLASAWVGVLAGAMLALFVVDPGSLPPRDWLLVWLVATVFGLTGTRIAAAAWIDHARRQGQLSWRVAVVGSGRWGREATRRLDRDRRDVTVVGHVDLGEDAAGGDLDLAVRELLTTRPVDQVAVAFEPQDLHHVGALLERLSEFPVEVGVLPALPAEGVPYLGHRRLGDLTSLTCLRKPIDGWAWLVKSAFDRTMALLALLFLMPLLALIAGAVKSTSSGPVLFTQLRLGFNQQPVNVFKFRSMYLDRCDVQGADHVKHATRDDPRVTPVGRFLRRTSLDELPQLLNVLRGDMSLVGPRPHAVAHDEYYATLIDGYLGRHRAKPGITGWAQINGCRGEIHSLEDMRRRIEFDLFYIDNWSLWLDLKILLRTALVCFVDERAY